MASTNPFPISDNRNSIQQYAPTDFAKKWRTEACSFVASSASTLIAYPLDTLKSRIQTSEGKTAMMLILDMWKRKTLDGVFKGVGVPLTTITVVRVASMSIFGRVTEAIDNVSARTTGFSPLQHANALGALPTAGTMATFAAAGAVSGCAVTAIACPFEMTKLRSQIAGMMEKELAAKATKSQASKQLGAIRFLRHLYKTRGIEALYIGWRLHLIRDTIGTAVYFMAYETTKQTMATASGNSPVDPAAVLVSGALCGILSWVTIYPVDSVKAVYQKAMLKQEKMDVPKIVYNRHAYRGFTVSCARSALINATFFSIFEATKKQVLALEYDDEE